MKTEIKKTLTETTYCRGGYKCEQKNLDKAVSLKEGRQMVRSMVDEYGGREEQVDVHIYI